MDYPQNLTESECYWFELIQKCRTSGKSDRQWLLENNIKSPTFSYHVKQLRKKACEIPESPKKVVRLEVHEVVLVFFESEALSVSTAPAKNAAPEISDNAVAIRL